MGMWWYLSGKCDRRWCSPKIVAFIAPKIIGGQGGPSPVGDLGKTLMTDALTLERVTWRQIGSDYVVEGYLAPDRK